MTETQSVEALLTKAYEILAMLDLDAAYASLEAALAIDFDDPEVLFALKCAYWWRDAVKRVNDHRDGIEAGDQALARWKAFKGFLSRFDEVRERPALAFKHFAFRLALARYQELTKPGETPDPEISLRLGRAYKGMGDYEAAISQLETAAKQKRDDAAVLSELADTYALIDQARVSKALFREAFFINPQKVDLEAIEADMIKRLAEKAAESADSPHELAEWIPVYGELGGVFSVKRELKPMEASKLKQSIYEMETELSNDGSRRAVLLPRLINRYFWLADHYMARKEAKERIDELLLKIKLLDPNVYKRYIA